MSRPTTHGGLWPPSGFSESGAKYPAAFFASISDHGVLWYEVRWKRDPLANLNSSSDKCVVFEIRHRHEAVDSRDTEPMKGIGHQLLEACVLDTCHALGARKVRCRLISTRLALARVVYQEFRNLTERPPLLAVVDDQSGAARLSRPNALLDAVGKIRAARGRCPFREQRHPSHCTLPVHQRIRHVRDRAVTAHRWLPGHQRCTAW